MHKGETIPEELRNQFTMNTTSYLPWGRTLWMAEDGFAHATISQLKTPEVAEGIVDKKK